MKSYFVKAMGTMTATSMVVGIIIGTGIFLTAGEVAYYIKSPLWILVAWLFGGVVAATGAITMAQLSSILPQTGGSYVYIREAFGKMLAFLYGCVLFLVLQCGSIAAVAIGFSVYFGKLFPFFAAEKIIYKISFPFLWELTTGQIIAVIIIVILSMVNYIGARFTGIVQLILTLLTLIAIFTFISVIFVTDHKLSIDLSVSAPNITSFGLALIPILWAFSGWYNINFVAEEIENSSRTIAISLLLGLTIVTVIYFAINLVYLLTIPVSQIEGQEEIAYLVMQTLMGEKSASLISLAIVLAALGTLNGLIFASPRAYFAMAKDGLFPFLDAKLHKRFATPYTFIVAQAIWAVLLVIIGKGSYKLLFTYVMFCGLLFTALVGVSLFVLNRKLPGKIILKWAYPVVPIFFIISSLGLAANVCYYKYWESLIGLAIVIVCFPFYFILKPHSNHNQNNS